MSGGMRLEEMREEIRGLVRACYVLRRRVEEFAAGRRAGGAVAVREDGGPKVKRRGCPVAGGARVSPRRAPEGLAAPEHAAERRPGKRPLRTRGERKRDPSGRIAVEKRRE